MQKFFFWILPITPKQISLKCVRLTTYTRMHLLHTHMIVHVICCTMAVAQVAGRSFDTRGPRFQSNQMQNWIHVYAVNYSRSVTFDGRFSRYQASLLDCRFIISIFYNSILLLLNLTCSIVRLSLSLESKNLLIILFLGPWFMPSLLCSRQMWLFPHSKVGHRMNTADGDCCWCVIQCIVLLK